MRTWLLALTVLAAFAGCRVRGPAAVPTVDGALGPRFLARQVVVAHQGGRTSTVHAVVQYDGSALVVLGLTPMQTKAFSIRQRGATVQIEGTAGVPAQAVLLDIHRAYFADRPRRARPDGWSRRRDPEGPGTAAVDELWRAGRLQQRVFGSRRAKGRRAADRIRWDGGLQVGTPARLQVPDVEIEHPALQLRLEIHTIEVTPIPGPPPATDHVDGADDEVPVEDR
ncbi:MAG: DUF3261 domain-containing protein [Nannocystaceae bacterium]|nr:DUF3261 domain-containing protein [Nannocystaceae bacterium]